MRSFVPLHHVRRDFAFRELSHALAQLLLLLCEREFHDPPLPLSVFPIPNLNTTYTTDCRAPLRGAAPAFLCYTPAHAPPSFSHAFRCNSRGRPGLFSRPQGHSPR